MVPILRPISRISRFRWGSRHTFLRPQVPTFHHFTGDDGSKSVLFAHFLATITLSTIIKPDVRWMFDWRIGQQCNGVHIPDHLTLITLLQTARRLVFAHEAQHYDDGVLP